MSWRCVLAACFATRVAEACADSAAASVGRGVDIRKPGDVGPLGRSDCERRQAGNASTGQGRVRAAGTIRAMRQWLRTQGGWWLAWLLAAGAGVVWLARAEIRQLHEDFEANGRIAHRLMSQQVVQYDAVLATLALLEPAAGAARPERRLPS